MKTEWRGLAIADDLALSQGSIEVRFSSGRKHRVDVTVEPDRWGLRAIVVRPSALEHLEGRRELLPWELNRTSTLVGYRYDERRRLIGEAWAPREADADEFQLLVRHLAAECDRLELQLTGGDEL